MFLVGALRGLGYFVFRKFRGLGRFVVGMFCIGSFCTGAFCFRPFCRSTSEKGRV
jgi:hypothetical protein